MLVKGLIFPPAEIYDDSYQWAMGLCEPIIQHLCSVNLDHLTIKIIIWLECGRNQRDVSVDKNDTIFLNEVNRCYYFPVEMV